jgi:aspartate kinase
MQELAEAGARVLNAQAVEFAKDRGIAIYARQTAGSSAETVVRRHPPRAPGRVAGIASERGLVLASLDAADTARLVRLLEAFDARETQGKELLYRGTGARHASLAVSLENVPDWPRLRAELEAAFGAGIELRENVGAVSAIGAGINARYENLRRALEVVTGLGVEPLGVATSSFRISLLLDASRVDAAVRALHTALVP